MKNFNTPLKAMLAAVMICTALFVQAQPVPEVWAEGFVGLNGITLDGDGNLWVAEAGSGNNDSKVSVVTPDKVTHPVVINLPSYFDTLTGDAPGAWRAYRLGNQLHVVVGGHLRPGAGSLYTFDLTSWLPGDPALTLANAIGGTDVQAFALTEGFVESDIYRAAWDDAGNAYIADAAANAIIKRNASTGALSVLHEFPPFLNVYTPFPPFIDYVPTGIIRNPAGGFFVCNLTGFPFLPGLSTVEKMDENGNVSTFADSLTLSVEMDVDAAGNLYVLQLGAFDTTFTPVPFAGKITKITPSGEKSVFAEAFSPGFLTGMALDGNGGVFVADLFTGQVLHLTFPSAAHEPADLNLLEINAFPNPTRSFSQVKFSLEEPLKASASLFSASGEMVWRKELGQLPAGENSLEVSLENLPADVYFISIVTPEKSGVLRLDKF